MDRNEYAMRSLQVLSAPGVGSELLLHEPGHAEGFLLLWLPAMGVPTRHYQPLAKALSDAGVGMALHEWRGIGSSSVRAARCADWGYHELLTEDLPAAVTACRKSCPRARLLLGGHSLGGQLACLYAGLHPGAVDGVAVVASGMPYWRCFRPWGPALRIGLSLVAWTARLKGYFPGRSMGFAGNESRGVMTDWTRSGRSGHYTVRGLEHDPETALSELSQPLLALRLQDDRLAPETSLRYLLRKMPRVPSEMHVLDAGSLGTGADHFAWMKTPHAVAERIVSWSRRLD
jgi:predicted alpha/beta hydrolase